MTGSLQPASVRHARYMAEDKHLLYALKQSALIGRLGGGVGGDGVGGGEGGGVTYPLEEHPGMLSFSTQLSIISSQASLEDLHSGELRSM